ncbi:MAG: MoaD/ThiS family protein [Vicinamibacterales bacterium]|nr:MoaD/ThiS family protein [Vicinamibacterales bacterium]MDP6610465.1 MoaD/ThiS family protein [Vicinamibacterales bacterium]
MSVRVFARLRDIVGAAELEREVPAGASVRRLWDGLVAEFPDAGAYAGSLSAAVNTEYAKMDTELHNGDEVAFLPPVSGGEGVATPRIGRCSTN